MSKEEAIGVLKENAGVLFDPGLVDVFIKTIQNEED
jgi:response regulator RpfG family c-di-GMP phosphodiesterase